MSAIRLTTRSALVLGLALAGSVAIPGCAQERAPIDRTQPYALDKSFFIGEDYSSTADDPEFWSQNTLIDVGYGANQSGLFTSTYAQPMSRVKWQVTEDLLIARLAYERIESSDGKGLGGPTQDGVVVAAFKIQKHFDIVNAYNSTTGEKLNVLEENSSDRPWFERSKMRVDWSKSLNTDSYDFDTLSLLGIYGGVKYESLAYYVSDPKDADAPLFDMDGGYFDITTKAFAKPGVINLSHLGWGIESFPACFLDNDFMGGSAPTGSCSPIEITLRHSFRKVEDNDFAPQDWDGYRFQSYGGFYIERQGYTRQYGMTDSQWHRFLSHYDIWENSFYYDDPEAKTGPVECFTPDTTAFGADPNADVDGNGTADECEAVGKGSQCNPFRQRCTLPYQDRTARPVVWYYSNDSYLPYFDATERATHEWDVAMRVAVQAARYAECEATAGADCATRFPLYTGQEDDNVDAVRLAVEVDDCRLKRAYAGRDCDEVADEVAAKRGYAPGVAAIAKMDEMIVLCHSPVEAGDAAACGEKRLPRDISAADCQAAREAGYAADDLTTLEICKDAISVRIGDLRYHQVNVLKAPQTPSPWGIYTDAHDPLTGETVSASINVWSHVNDLWSTKVIDTLRWMNGELDVSEITEGENIHQAAEAFRSSQNNKAAPRMSPEEVARRTRDFAGGSFLPESAEADAAHRHAAANAQPLPAEVMAEAAAIKQQLTGVATRVGAASAMSPIYAQRRAQVANTKTEAQLMTPMMQKLHGVEGMALTGPLMDRVSPMRGGNPTLQRELKQMKEVALAEHGACVLHEAAAPVAMAGLGKVLQEKFGNFDATQSDDVQIARAERMRDYLARAAQYAVVVHEMGHSIGLRHNFVSSADSWGYRPQYWQLRTRNGTVTTPCDGTEVDGKDCVGPRYFDPITEEEDDNLLWMWMHSSVMDYAGEVTQDTLGLGVYDFAATRMFYGGTVAVLSDPSYAAGTARASGMLAKMDNFGGIIGMQYQTTQADSFHYSEANTKFGLISKCTQIDPEAFRPARWDEEKNGKWSPLLDGLLVKLDGQYTRCRQQPIDHARWQDLRAPTSAEFGGFFRAEAGIDKKGRVRAPYGFASDNWADTGNLSVFRHDNGADPYELFDFFIAQQEIFHIFDNYRRDRTTFSVKSAAGRALGRYNSKMRDAAKGLGLLRNIYQEVAVEAGYEFSSYWPFIAPFFFKENILASGIAFDHFARQLARPQDGGHTLVDGVLRSTEDTNTTPGPTAVRIPNGATGFVDGKSVGWGGRPLENKIADDKGDFDSTFTINAGSYYGKAYTAMLLTESVDNFVSASRTDFLDGRYRAVSMADLFPDGYRRWLASNLTGDDYLKGARVAAAGGAPTTDADGFSDWPIGWTSWWGETPRTCFPGDNVIACDSFGFDGIDLTETGGPASAIPIDPQVGWEIQKFLIAWTLMYLPENQQQRWIDMLRIWELGKDADPGIANRIEFHNPTGKTYIAKTFGKEEIFGIEVQRGIAARILEHANDLLSQAYVVADGPDMDGDGEPDWFIPVINGTTGLPMVQYDPALSAITPEGGISPDGREGCNATDSSDCDCTSNRACMVLAKYSQVPFFLRQALDDYGVGGFGLKGIY